MSNVIVPAVVLDSDRDRRSWAWLQANFSAAQLMAAIEAIPGKRRVYVSNVAKALGVAIPDSALYLAPDEALAKLAAIRSSLKGNRFPSN